MRAPNLPVELLHERPELSDLDALGVLVAVGAVVSA